MLGCRSKICFGTGHPYFVIERSNNIYHKFKSVVVWGSVMQTATTTRCAMTTGSYYMTVGKIHDLVFTSSISFVKVAPEVCFHRIMNAFKVINVISFSEEPVFVFAEETVRVFF